MEARTFARFLSRLSAYFQRPDPPDASVTLWLEAVSGIPDEAADPIYQALTAQGTFPRNLPGAMWAAYNDWRTTHPPSQKDKHDPKTAGCWQGRWIVARWIPELAEWAIFHLPCGGCHPGTGPTSRDEVLAKLPEEPMHYSEQLPPKALVYPDRDSIHKMRELIAPALQARQPKAEINLWDEIPF